MSNEPMEYVRSPGGGWITEAEASAALDGETQALDPITATLDAATAADELERLRVEAEDARDEADAHPGDEALAIDAADAEDAYRAALRQDAERAMSGEPETGRVRQTIPASIAPGEVRNGDDHFGPPVEDPLPLSAEYRRLAGHVLAARDARDAKREERRKANAQHASDDAARAGLVKQAKEYVSLAEEALGEFVRANGTGDPDRILRGTGQRITRRGGES